MDCEECKSAYALENETPDCENCKKPSYLDQKNKFPLSIWHRCNKHRESTAGMSVIKQRLKVSEIMATCEAYGAYMEDFKKVLIIEDIVYPMIMETQNARVKNSPRNR